MEKVIIWHNPRCSKSRQTLELLNHKSLDLEVREYLADPPSAEEIKNALSLLGVSAKEIVRTKEAEFKTLDLSLDNEEAVIQALHLHPRLIERPIVICGKRAVIGRPPENVKQLF